MNELFRMTQQDDDGIGITIAPARTLIPAPDYSQTSTEMLVKVLELTRRDIQFALGYISPTGLAVPLTGAVRNWLRPRFRAAFMELQRRNLA